MGCLNSTGAADEVWACQYCGMQFRSYQQADHHEKYQCPRRPGGGVGAYGQPARGPAQRYTPGQQQQYTPGQPPGGQQPPMQIRCAGCAKAIGVPPGHAQVMCPYCNAVQACPQPPQPTIPQQVYNQQLGLQPAPMVGQPGPPPSGRRKALLVGINYFGTSAELRGCINDVHRMRGVLMGMYGFSASPDCMMVLTDDNPDRRLQPTRANVMRSFQWLAQGVQPGDVLFFHYSGHGAQQEDPNYAEEDGYDETICPADFNSAGMIVDDEIFDQIIATLPPGVKLTAVMDCCHSGTGLDLPFTLAGGQWMEDDNPCHSAGDVILISGCQDEQTSSDGGGGYGRPMGAMTTALCNTLERSPVLTHSQLLEQLRGELVSGGFEQVPSLTSSQRFDANSKLFNPCENIEGNTNPQLGRQFRKKKHPRNPGLLNGGLGEMLMAGAMGFMVADMMGGGDLATGMLIGGADALMGGADMLGGIMPDFGGGGDYDDGGGGDDYGFDDGGDY
uniref:C2H2-type domain-containing protein n=1 Tax=Alexandrium monilatum TaxID=311494 RepID=A0A7S4QP01_9DINO|mmetsp:Transcript_115750/g.369345  ORF Transcript_115750/g.369345 Transcript_115750/m.369345 type:complete len:502 (+) Transcript_115750:76-1581(+)